MRSDQAAVECRACRRQGFTTYPAMDDEGTWRQFCSVGCRTRWTTLRLVRA